MYVVDRHHEYPQTNKQTTHGAVTKDKYSHASASFYKVTDVAGEVLIFRPHGRYFQLLLTHIPPIAICRAYKYEVTVAKNSALPSIQHRKLLCKGMFLC